MSKKIYAEFLGTFTLVLIGVGSIMTGKADLLGVALAHGLAIAVMIGAFAASSGAHFNPAVSFAMLITRRMNISEFATYVLAQLAGATVAALLLKAVYPAAVGAATGVGTPALGDGVSTGNGFIVEVLTTFLLVTIIFGLAVDKRTPFAGIASISIGATIVLDILWAGPLTGAAMNPARWFGPALASGNWGNGWIWIAGPLVGGAIAALAYQTLIKPEK